MKIIVTEEQFKLIVEDIEALASKNPSDLKEYPGRLVTATVPTTNDDGEIETGRQPVGDDIAKKLSPQSPFSHGRMTISRQS